MKEKNLENSNNLQDLDALLLKVKSNAVNALFDDKSPKYDQRFKSWAKETQGEHFDNLVDALLTGIANILVRGQHESVQGFDSNASVIFLRGQVQGILTVQEWIRTYASETKIITEED